MKTQGQPLPPNAGARAPGREPPEQMPVPAREPDFLERHDHPDAAEELERQQDA